MCKATMVFCDDIDLEMTEVIQKTKRLLEDLPKSLEKFFFRLTVCNADPSNPVIRNAHIPAIWYFSEQYGITLVLPLLRIQGSLVPLIRDRPHPPVSRRNRMQ